MINPICDKRAGFLKSVGKMPTRIHMTRDEMKELSVYMRDVAARERRLCVEPKNPRDISSGDMVYGMLIAETETPGLQLSV